MKVKRWCRDVGFAVGAAVGAATATYVLVVRPWQLRRGATDEEVVMPLPGDDLVPIPKCGYTQAITINASPAEVWPWLVQIGYKRAGWYSHDAIHRMMGIAGSVEDAERSAWHVIPALQTLSVGDVVEIAPGMGYRVVHLEPKRALVLYVRLDTGAMKGLEDGDPLPENYMSSSWAWYLEEVSPGVTRLVVRVRGDYSPGVASVLAAQIPNELGSLVMQPKTLQGIKERAEARRGMLGDVR
ncbi:MAG: SRPBCC family protein [Anaerolineae bacterium]|nr:SRPBCC family protein [Anaerolineae bacterium]